MRALILFAALGFILAPAKSQTNDGNGSTVKGQIYARYTHGFTVQLYDLSRHTVLSTSDVRPDGAFELHGAAAGSYLVKVLNEAGDEAYEGSVNVGGPTMPVVIRLPERSVPAPLTGTVSVRQLQHAPSRKAFDAAAKAQRFSEAGDFTRAQEFLEKAIALSPDYADAHTNLGAQYLRAARYADAVEETKRAIALDVPTTLRLCNLGFAQLHLSLFSEAMESVRLALRLSPQDGSSHYLMGLLLFVNHAPIADVKMHLEIASRTVPFAKEVWEKIAAGKLAAR